MRLVKPYQPVTIPAAVPPGSLFSLPGDGIVALSWAAFRPILQCLSLVYIWWPVVRKWRPT